MTYQIECFGDLRVAKSDLDDLKRAVEKEYDQCITASSEETCLTLMTGIGFDHHDEGDAIRFTRERQHIGEVLEWLPVLAPFLEGQHITWLGEDGTIQYDAFHDGVMHEEAWDNPDELIVDYVRLKRRYELTRD